MSQGLPGPPVTESIKGSLLVNVEVMTVRLTNLANASRTEAGMAKTGIQHIYERKPIKVTAEEVAKAEAKYKHQCDFCLRKFKTNKAMLIHRATSCVHNYATTDELSTLEEIVGVFGRADARWFLVKFEDYDESEWEREHLLKRDKCHEAIRSFWLGKIGVQPNTRILPGQARMLQNVQTRTRPKSSQNKNRSDVEPVITITNNM